MSRHKLRRPTAWFLASLAIASTWGVPLRAQSATDLERTEREACTKNLKQIYAAIQAYEKDRKDLPNWLSDLVPDYISDANLLVCPVCKRTGRTEPPPLADPKLPSSYLFEFCPLPLGDTAPQAPNRTRREWKRRQMGLLGSVVPILRCRFHNPVLNVAFDGKVYDSPSTWELAFTNHVPADQLTAARIFSEQGGAATASNSPKPYPKRDTRASAQLVDLSKFYNAQLTDPWHGNDGNDLASLPTGLQKFGEVLFDVRGIIQIAGQGATNFPGEVKGIAVQQKCKRMHFLHAAGFGAIADEGKVIGYYVIHFTDNQVEMKIPIQYGQSVRNWHQYADEPAPGKQLKVAWTGENAVSKREGRSLRLFVTTWTNLLPDIPIESLDYVSSMAGSSAPFLIAISVD